MMKRANQKLGPKLKSLAIDAYYFRFQICAAMTVLSAVYLLLALFQIKVLIGFGVFFMSIFGLVYFWWRNLREKGIINTFNPKTRDLLLRRSIADWFRDQVYYPYITKIIGVFVRVAISKPHPEQVQKIFEEQLPDNVKRVIFTKGILHLAPEKVERIVLEKQCDLISVLDPPAEVKPNQQILVPKSYGTVNQMWDRRGEYEGQVIKIHELTISKQIMKRLNERIKWHHIIAFSSLLSFAIMKVKGRKLGKIFLYNGSALGIFLLLGILMIKYKNSLKTEKQNPHRKYE